MSLGLPEIDNSKTVGTQKGARMIDAAVIGLGRWGKSLVNAVQGKSARLRFVHGVSKEPDDARAFAQQHGFKLTTELADAIENPEVQAIFLATPHSLHVEQGSA